MISLEIIFRIFLLGFFGLTRPQLAVYYPTWDTFGYSEVLKNYYILNFNNISTTRPILDLKLPLDRARHTQYPVFGVIPLGVTPKSDFTSNFMIFNGIYSLFWYILSNKILLSGTHWGTPVLFKLIMYLI